MTQQANWIKERAAIRARLEAATPGPWRDDTDQFSSEVTTDGRDGGDVWICQLWSKSEEDFENREANSAFIAHAPEDLRTLLAKSEEDEREVERLNREVDALREIWKGTGNG
jgi:hypothetical protein